MEEHSERATNAQNRPVTGENIPSDPEVLATPKRRRFTAKYKLSIVTEAAGFVKPGSIGALLRREGLYSSHLTKWRRQVEAGELASTTGRKRGPAAKLVNPMEKEIKRLEREKRALERKLKQAELVIEFQKKFCGDTGSGERERRQAIATVRDRPKGVGIAMACLALALSIATFYRSLRPARNTPRPSPARKIGKDVRELVITRSSGVTNSRK